MRKLLIYLLLMLLISSNYCFAEEDDNGTDEDGRVVWSETLANRCNLNSRKADMGDCFKKLASDIKLKTPSGDDYTTEINQILHEQTRGYLTIALQRLVDNGAHHDDSYNEQGEGAAGADPSKDTRDVLEKIGKTTQRNFETLSNALDNMSMKHLSYQYETLYNQIIPQIANSMSLKEAEDPELRKDKFH